MPSSTPFPNKTAPRKLFSLPVIIIVILGIILGSLFVFKSELMTSAAFPGRIKIQAIDELDDWSVNDLLEVEFAVSGGTGPYQWSVSKGTLPPQTSLRTYSSSDQTRFQNNRAKISGTLTDAGTYTFTLTARDARNNSKSQDFDIKVSSILSQTQTPNPVSSSIDTSGDQIFIDKYPNKPVIIHKKGGLQAGVDQGFIFANTNVETHSPDGKKYPIDQCFTTLYVSWGDSNDPIEAVPAVCSPDGKINFPVPDKVLGHHTYRTGGTKIIRAWISAPGEHVLDIPEGQLTVNITGSPVNPVSCKDDSSISFNNDSSGIQAQTIEPFVGQVKVAQVKLTPEKDGWLTKVYLKMAAQSNLFYLSEDLRRIEIRNANDETVGKYLLPFDPEFQDTGSYHDPLSGNGNVKGNSDVGTWEGERPANDPLSYIVIQVPITSLRVQSGQSVTFSLWATFNNNAKHNNMWKFGMTNANCYGGHLLKKNSKAYFDVLSYSAPLGPIFTIKNPTSSIPFQFRNYNKAPCTFGQRCEHMIPANSGIKTFRR